MDYLEMFEFGLKAVVVALSVGLAVSLFVNWREKRKERKSIKAMNDRHYAQEAQDAVKEAEEFLRELRKR
jgi:uncharacterized protein HemX